MSDSACFALGFCGCILVRSDNTNVTIDIACRVCICSWHTGSTHSQSFPTLVVPNGAIFTRHLAFRSSEFAAMTIETCFWSVSITILPCCTQHTHRTPGTRRVFWIDTCRAFAGTLCRTDCVSRTFHTYLLTDIALVFSCWTVITHFVSTRILALSRTAICTKCD